ncbi:hypothetical protein DRH29_05755 [candidate division Kazan bacterium]|uniref:Pectate lyase superfamily protein domain-containing protein n=1 Tax=candidate division Kazan bacterium TaxID=2202143 RepID=A0A420ZAZ3_UNCK3|nr:MAG: hypothetical protein DRH29_05755 [candidate division Kazan bacterium]
MVLNDSGDLNIVGNLTTDNQVNYVYCVNSSSVDQGVDDDNNSVKDIIDAVGATNKATLYFRHDPSSGEFTDYTFTTAETIPSNFTLKFDRGARLVVASVNDVTLQCNIPVGPQQIFKLDSTGEIVFTEDTTIPEVYPQWWGAKADGTTDDTTALNAAIQCGISSLSKVHIIGGRYRLADSLLIDENVYVFGDGYRSKRDNTDFENEVFGTILYFDYDAATHPYAIEVKGTHVTIRDIEFETNQPAYPGADEATWTPTTSPWAIYAWRDTGAGYQADDANKLTLKGLMIRNFTHGIKLWDLQGATIEDIHGTCFNQFLYADGIPDALHIRGLHDWAYGDGYASTYKKANADFITLGRVDGGTIEDIFCIYVKTGIVTDRSEAAGSSGGPERLNLSNIYLDQVDVGMSLTDAHTLVVSNLAIYCITTGIKTIISDTTSPGLLFLSNADITGPDEYAIDLRVPGQNMLSNVRIRDYNGDNAGYTAIYAANSVVVHLDNLSVYTANGNGAAVYSGPGTVTGDFGESSYAGDINFDGYLTTVGGVHVGGTTNPGTDNLVVDGDVGIGTSAPEKKLHVMASDASATAKADAVAVFENNGDLSINLLSGTNNNGAIAFGDPASGYAGYILYKHSDDSFTWNNGADNMTLNSSGDLSITGALSKGSGSFKITHPLDENKWLYHSFIEGPKADLIYRGAVKLSDGNAVIDLNAESGMTAGTFEALTQDVQVFAQNQSGWTPVKGSVSGATLTITSKDPCDDVINWLVVAERADDTIKAWSLTDNDGHLIPEWPKNN